MTSIASVGWAALPTLFAYNLLMLGIEAATVECEKPFDWNANHLTLGKFCVVAARNIAQALKEVSDRAMTESKFIPAKVVNNYIISSRLNLNKGTDTKKHPERGK
eukprot:scaffold8389_cov140-Skeletonema_menzelii.AAC.2